MATGDFTGASAAAKILARPFGCVGRSRWWQGGGGCGDGEGSVVVEGRVVLYRVSAASARWLSMRAACGGSNISGGSTGRILARVWICSVVGACNGRRRTGG